MAGGLPNALPVLRRQLPGFTDEKPEVFEITMFGSLLEIVFFGFWGKVLKTCGVFCVFFWKVRSDLNRFDGSLSDFKSATFDP